MWGAVFTFERQAGQARTGIITARPQTQNTSKLSRKSTFALWGGAVPNYPKVDSTERKHCPLSRTVELLPQIGVNIPEDGGIGLLRNVDIFLPDYTMSRN